MELRCASGILHGILDGQPEGEATLEVACKSARCGKKPGVVIRHRFKLASGELLDTRTYKDPVRRDRNGSRDRISIRTA